MEINLPPYDTYRMNKTCNQCEKNNIVEVSRTIGGSWCNVMCVCLNPSCPNFGIVQIAAEDMPVSRIQGLENYDHIFARGEDLPQAPNPQE